MVGALLVLAVTMAGIAPVAAVSTGPNAALGPAPAQTATETCSFPVSATDATGANVTIDGEPESVVAIGASTAQIMWSIGAQDKVVGMPQGPTTSYLDGSQNRTDVYQADGYTVATERVVGTDPDLVVAANIIPNETVETLRGAGLTVYKSTEAGSIDDVYDDVNTTGRLVGSCSAAAETVNETQETVSAVEEAVEDEENPRVLYPQSGGFAVGNNTFINDVVETAGGDNIAVNAGIEGYQQISNETIAERNPQWIVTSSPATIPTGEPYASTAAVQRNQTVTVNANYISQPGPRLVAPLVTVASALHPEAMQQANLTTVENTTASTSTTSSGTASTAATSTGAVATDGGTSVDAATSSEAEATSVEATAGGAEADETTAAGGATAAGSGDSENATAGGETTSSNGPGFGVVGAAIALLGAALFARRRP
ncbi:periplasmic binding protein [Halococcus hamelinensis 100A6]|uniref:Periplasmic binding protein n=2 Tax=Halococcus hamelinensis TaxID=332168 RepID=M0LZ26_9EURY|nr:periplasmic binding protein [Halococcus hamelinensis 100A6]